MKNMEDIMWWHQVPLDDGRITPGQSPVSTSENWYLFNEVDFTDKSVIDIGCWDGYFSFMAEKRGARRVVGFDDPNFRWGGMDGFDFLSEHFKSNVEFIKGTIYRPIEEKFDVVLCYGVLYHLSDPLLAAINVFQMSREIAIFESLLHEEESPELKLIEPGYWHDDPSNIYSISTGFLNHVARLSGFELVIHKQQAPHRGAMMFRTREKKMPAYHTPCFPFPPLSGNL